MSLCYLCDRKFYSFCANESFVDVAFVITEYKKSKTQKSIGQPKCNGGNDVSFFVDMNFIVRIKMFVFFSSPSSWFLIEFVRNRMFFQCPNYHHKILSSRQTPKYCGVQRLQFFFFSHSIFEYRNLSKTTARSVCDCVCMHFPCAFAWQTHTNKKARNHHKVARRCCECTWCDNRMIYFMT